MLTIRKAIAIIGININKMLYIKLDIIIYNLHIIIYYLNSRQFSVEAVLNRLSNISKVSSLILRTKAETDVVIILSFLSNQSGFCDALFLPKSIVFTDALNIIGKLFNYFSLHLRIIIHIVNHISADIFK